MPVDLDDQLAALGTALLRDSAPITLAELRSHPTEARPQQEDTRHATDVVERALAPSAGRRRRWVGAATIATAAASLVALILVVDRGGSDGSATSLPEPGELQVDGVLGLDPTAPIAAGWTVQAADDDVLGRDGSGPITRRYATDSPTPETGPALDVATFDVGAPFAPAVSESDAPFDVNGAEARWLDLDTDAARGLAFTVDGRWIVVTGYRVTETEVVSAAEHVEWSADGFGAVVGAAGLPPGVVEQYVSGGFSEMWLLPLAPTRDIPMIRWTSGDRIVRLQSVPADEAFVRAQRIGATTVTDVTVDGSPSFVATWEPQADLRWMAWTDGASSYLLAANELSSDELVAFAEALAPLTVDEWHALLDSAQSPAVPATSPVATVPPALPTVDLLVGVDFFPAIDAAALGLGDSPEATFTSMPTAAGEGLTGAWRAVVGRQDGVGYRDLIVVDIITGTQSSDGSTDPVSTDYPGFTEYVFETDAARITVSGEEPSSAVTSIRDAIILGSTPPEVGVLPDGLVVVAEPFSLTADAGHFPVLAFDGLTIAVEPTPAVGMTSAPGGSLAPTVVAGRSTFVADAGDGMISLASELDDGSTLHIDASGMSMVQVTAIAEAVQLVDQQTWIARYQPHWVDEDGATVDLPASLTVPATSSGTDGRNLAEGATGDDVVALQERLSLMGFDPGPADGVFGEATEQAVWAFEKLVLGVPRDHATGLVTSEIWERMQADSTISPRRPQADGADHVEIYLPEQVLVVFHDDQAVLVTHVSTGTLDGSGAPAEYCETITIDTDEQGSPLDQPEQRTICGYSKTPGGIFDVDRFVPGTRHGPLGTMWNPLYFNYGLAIHGAADVPLEPASHGDVRVPMHVAEHLHDLVPIGSWVYVWDGVTEPEDQTRESELPVFPYPAPTTSP